MCSLCRMNLFCNNIFHLVLLRFWALYPTFYESKKKNTWSWASDRNFLRVLEKPLRSKKWATACRRRGLWSLLGFFMFSTTWRGFRARRIGSTASNSPLLRVLGIQCRAEWTSPLRLRPPLLTTGKVGNGLIHSRNCGVLFRVCRNKNLKPPVTYSVII